MTAPAFTIASEVTVQPVEWLWFPFVPLGKLTCFAGRMGQGKTLWTHWLAASVTTGSAISHPTPAGAVLLSAEDDDADTIVPRLRAAGADLSRVALIAGTELDLDVIVAACERVDARLLTIDPFTAYMPGTRNAYKAQDVRLVLAPIVELARERSLAAVAVQHVNRSDATDALDRIADSQGLPQVARSVLVWGPDPQDVAGDLGTRKVLTRPKNNLASGSTSAASSFEIATVEVPGAGVQPHLIHRGSSDARADDVVQTQEVRTQVDAARVFLQEFLADGPVEAKAVEAAASEAGIGVYALRRARERYVRSYRPSGNQGPYVWELLTATTTFTNKQQHSRTETDIHGLSLVVGE